MENFKNWWYCDNIISHRGQIGLLSMNEPRVFILIRDYADCYFANFDEFKNSIAEVNFFDPSDRQTADIESILVDAWNFMATQEAEEERLYEEREDF